MILQRSESSIVQNSLHVFHHKIFDLIKFLKNLIKAHKNQVKTHFLFDSSYIHICMFGYLSGANTASDVEEEAKEREY